jgi:hypothetical protein
MGKSLDSRVYLGLYWIHANKAKEKLMADSGRLNVANKVDRAMLLMVDMAWAEEEIAGPEARDIVTRIYGKEIFEAALTRFFCKFDDEAQP